MHVNQSILVEKSIARAAYLQKILDWAGGIINSSCFEEDATNELRGNLSCGQLIVYEDIPLKESKQSIESNQWVLNWPLFIGYYISGEDNFREKFFKYTGEPQYHAIKQMNNTFEFARKKLGS